MHCCSAFRNGNAEGGPLDHSSEIGGLYTEMRRGLLVDPEKNIPDFFKKLDNAARLFGRTYSQSAVGRDHYIFLPAHEHRSAFVSGGNDITGIQSAAADRDLRNA